jgi:hypothetical protein
VEKNHLIHNPARVYYHYHPFFLSKLTKEGKPSRLPSRRFTHTTDGYAGTTQTLFCLQKKKAKPVIVATTTLAMTQLFGRGISRQRFKHEADTARHPFCLQKERDAAIASTTGSRPADAGDRPAGRMQNDKSSAETNPTVENRLHIHRTGCAERPLFLLPGFLSNIGSAPIQCLSSRSVSA